MRIVLVKLSFGVRANLSSLKTFLIVYKVVWLLWFVSQKENLRNRKCW